jgi:3-oxoacyl-[acyl-carrier protein] reductase
MENASMDLGLAGKRALVTGASSGLGLGCARALSAEGARVALVSRSAEKLDAAAASLDGETLTLTCDVSDPDDTERMISQVEEGLGGVDILIANAGGPPPGTFETTDLDAYRPALELNLLSTVTMCKRIIPAMREQGWGRVVAITSIAVREPIETLILSNTARAGLTAFLKTTAREVAADGVTVNSLQPGLHLTDRLTNLYDDVAALAAGVPANRLGDPDDFGAIAAFLCSDEAKFVTGVAVPVDGGASRGMQ